MIKDNNIKENSKKKIPLGIKIGVIIFFIGLIIIIVSYLINYTINYNPYINANPDPKSLQDTFEVPEGAKYDRSYHIYIYELAGTKISYSKKMYSRHKIKNYNVKLEGGYVTQTKAKTVFSFYIFNLSEEGLNANLDIKLKTYNNAVSDELTYKIESLKPLESKNIEIEVDKKAINSYDYEVSIS